MTEPTARVKRLRQRALETTTHWNHAEFMLLYSRGWHNASGLLDANIGMSSMLVRRARVISTILRGLTPVIDPDDLVVGKASMRPLTPAEEEELRLWKEFGMPSMPKVGGMGSHMAVDFPKVLDMGVEGIQHQIRNLSEHLNLSNPQDVDKATFYRACHDALDGLLAAADNYATLAASLAEAESDAVRKAELEAIASICAKVPRRPAETFREAVQSVHFLNAMLTLACPGLFQLGRPDRYLWPFYQRDKENGQITKEQAQELWDCVCVLFNECVPRGLATGYMVGGRDGEGHDVSNELTEIMIESVGHTRMAYPGVGLCYHNGSPKWSLDMSADLLSKGHSHPAIFNDEVITAGIMDLGLPRSEACEYIHSTCVEITPVASSGVWVASPYINLLQLLQDALGVESEPVEYGTFEELKQAVRFRLEQTVDSAVKEQNLYRSGRYYQGGQPLVSCFVKDCLERGLDIDQGGARHNWIEMSFVGLSNLVDALAAIRTMVFEKGDISLETLRTALESDFDKMEPLRLSLLNKCPKYGNDDPAVDDLAVEITEWVQEACSSHRAYLDSAFVPGFFCWIMHEHLGSQTKASADGRRAGFALGDGSGPAQGREKNGPTAAVLSTTRWNHQPMLGGVAMNLKFTPDRNRDVLRQNIADVVATYCKQGGFEVQVNVVDNATLRAAQKDPESYRDLVVRIGGYSDYFVSLSEGMQEEVIARSEINCPG